MPSWKVGTVSCMKVRLAALLPTLALLGLLAMSADTSPASDSSPTLYMTVTPAGP